MRIRTLRDVGTAIRAHRHERGWSQTELAVRARVSRKWVSEAERAEGVAGVHHLLAVFEALGVDLELAMPGEPAAAVPAHAAGAIDLDGLLAAHRGPMRP